MSKDKYLLYRGQLRALLSDAEALIFTTEHTERHPMAVYWVSPQGGALKSQELPGGGLALARDDKRLYVACTDGRVYAGSIEARGIGELSALSGYVASDDPISGLAVLKGGLLAVASGAQLALVDRDGARGVVQTLTTPDPITALTSDVSGEWLVAGTRIGEVHVFDGERQSEFAFSAKAKLHEGEVSQLLFEQDELRVLSTGADQRLLVTHVRGELDSEDRGGAGMHDKRITGMIQGVQGRFYTGGADSTLKAWPGGRNNRRPVTQKDGVSKVVALAMVQYNDKPHLVSAGEDGTLRLFAIGDEGVVGELVLVLRDAFAWAKEEFSAGDPPRREKALKRLAVFNDSASLELLAQRVDQDNDHKLKVLATELLGASGNPRAVKLLERLLGASRDDVRVAALEGLRQLCGAEDLRPLKLALNQRKRDIGERAVDALGGLSRRDDKALELLISALDQDPEQVRARALSKLEAHYGKDSPEAPLLALKASKQDIRVLALVRAYQLVLLDEPRVASAMRRALEDGDANVRLNAFLVSLKRRPELGEALRSRDAALHLQLHEVETFGQDRKPEERSPKTPKATSLDKLTALDVEPLLEAMASRALDTCMRGALGLALLQDTRAFGTLLQLSREKDLNARVQACRAFEALTDPRSINRLRMMLRDEAPAVRDAAFSALAKLESDEPLSAARAGLSAEHEDVRRRGLQLLVSLLKKQKTHDDAALWLLRQTLNDRFQGVRSEAFKAVLSLNVGGSAPAALRFGSHSLHADVRLDVLVELMAQVQEDWAWGMLLEMFQDPDPTLRKDAFEFALKKAKKDRRREALASALGCRYPDLRLASVKELTERSLTDFADLIVQSLDDEDAQVRQTAVSALVASDAPELLRRAMLARHADVRVRAAVACAGLGDEQALPVLVSLATEPKPEQGKGDANLWKAHVVEALSGLAELGDESARTSLLPLIESKEKEIRQAAVRALVWTSRPGALEALRDALRHSDDTVKKEAALGLAYYGDSAGASMIFGSSGVSPDEELLAALGLIEVAEDQFFAFLDRSAARLRRRAFLLLLLLEMSEQDGIPDKCLAALSSAYADVRLDAARGLESFADHDAFKAYVREAFLETVPQRARWDIKPEVLEAMSLAVTYGGAQVRVRAARLLETLREDTSQSFDRAWEIYLRRYGAQLDALRQARLQAPAADFSEKIARAWRFLRHAVGAPGAEAPDGGQGFRDALTQLVFGAYVGLSRQGGEERYRLSALHRLNELASRDAMTHDAVVRVLVLALGDSAASVRQQAFQRLLGLNMDAAALANEALATGQRDMGSSALQLLSERGGAVSGEAILREALLSKTDGLEDEAARLLAELIGWTQTHRAALGAQSSGLRSRAMGALQRVYDDEPSAQEAVLEGLRSRFDDVRQSAVIFLAGKKHPATFEVLEELVRSAEAGQQRVAVEGFSKLGDARAAGILLDRIEQDEDKTAQVDALLSGAASFRDPVVFGRLVAQIERGAQRWNAYRAALTVSGHDQHIPDREDEQPDRTWETRQHPRHDALLAKLLEVAYKLADQRMLRELIAAARWSRSSAVDSALEPLGFVSDETVREEALEAIGWRARKRGGPVQLLRKVLNSGDPKAQFLAAEGLALAGHRDGVTVLMTSARFLEDDDDRSRAVLALGELGDLQSLDLLLQLVTDEEDGSLRPAAAEALGHMAKSERAEDIFKILSQLAQENDYYVQPRAMMGLRWFNTPAAWRVLRDCAKSRSWRTRQGAAQIMGHLHDPANIDALIGLLRNDNDSDVAQAAAESLRKLYGPDSLEPDYALVQARIGYLNAQNQVIERLRERGEVGRILEVLAKIRPEHEDKFLKPLVTALLARQPLPVAEAAPMLASPEDRTAVVAARLVGYAGAEAKAQGEAVVAAAAQARTRWQEARQLNRMSPAISERYRMLIWACGRLQVGLEETLQAAALPNEPSAATVREEALLVLSQPWVGERGVATLEAIALSGDASLRELASVSLRRIAPERAQALLSRALEDAPSFNQLMGQGQAQAASAQPTLREAATGIHFQGVVLPHLVKLSDVEGLARALRDRSLSDETRLGILESLSQINDASVDALLAEVGKNDDEDEELRKAAWRAMRRARRLRQKRQDQAEVRA